MKNVNFFFGLIVFTAFAAEYIPSPTQESLVTNSFLDMHSSAPLEKEFFLNIQNPYWDTSALERQGYCFSGPDLN